MTAYHALPQELDVDLAGLSSVAAQWFVRLPVSDQRIQSVPDGRTLRFYQSTGLLDRPLRYDGRVARYGRRHLLQLLAIRALQVRGQSLAQIQAALAGSPDSELTRVVYAALSSDAARGAPQFSLAAAKSPFAEPIIAQSVIAGSATTDSAIPASAATATTPFTAVELAPGVVITIDSRVITDPARVIALLRRAIQGEET